MEAVGCKVRIKKLIGKGEIKMRNYFLEKYEVEFAKHAEIINSYNEK